MEDEYSRLEKIADVLEKRAQELEALTVLQRQNDPQGRGVTKVRAVLRSDPSAEVPRVEAEISATEQGRIQRIHKLGARFNVANALVTTGLSSAYKIGDPEDPDPPESKKRSNLHECTSPEAFARKLIGYMQSQLEQA